MAILYIRYRAQALHTISCYATVFVLNYNCLYVYIILG